MSPTPDLISLLDADPDLGETLDPAERDRARAAAMTRVSRLPAGAWDVAAALVTDVHHHGFLVADGLVARQVEVLGRRCVELIGPGDVLRPWRWDETGSHVQAEVDWTILDPADLAVLDNGLVSGSRRGPRSGLELFARGTRRAHALAVTLAIAHHQRVDDRLLLTLWHLAERFGKVGSAGISVPIPLPHQRLGDLIGAHRPSVTTAIGELVRTGSLSRGEDGRVLHGAPPEALRHHRLTAAMT